MSSPGNSLNITQAGLVKFDGTNAFTGVTVTQYDVLVGAASNGITSVGPGQAGQVLQSNGAGYNPSYSTPTYPSVGGTNRQLLSSNGTNNVYTTETWATPGTSGNVLTSDGTNWTSAAAPGGGLLLATGTLTSSQVKNLHATPIQAIAAPGSGKTIVILESTVKLNYGGTSAFTASSGQTIDLYFGTSLSYFTVFDNISVKKTQNWGNISQPGNLGGTATTDVSNVQINLYNPDTTEISGNAANDNTIAWTILYYIANI